jgi:uncharacterized protein
VGSKVAKVKLRSILGLSLSLFLGCHRSADRPSTDSPSPAEAGDSEVPVRFDVGSHAVVFVAELADSPEERRVGLMNRTSLSEDKGMLFVFPNEGHHTFWMRNTLIPLDMVFISASKEVVGIVHQAEPETDTSRGVDAMNLYVLEVLGGQARERGLATGQAVHFMVDNVER